MPSIKLPVEGENASLEVVASDSDKAAFWREVSSYGPGHYAFAAHT